MNVAEATAVCRFAGIFADVPKGDDARAEAADDAVEALLYLLERAEATLYAGPKPAAVLAGLARAEQAGWLGALRWAARERHLQALSQEVAR